MHDRVEQRPARRRHKCRYARRILPHTDTYRVDVASKHSRPPTNPPNLVLIGRPTSIATRFLIPPREPPACHLT